MPLELSEEWYQAAAVAETTLAMHDEELRTRRGFERHVPSMVELPQSVQLAREPQPPKQPAVVTSGPADPLQIWKMLPALKHLQRRCSASSPEQKCSSLTTPS
jgi:hypothetical protein